MHLVRASDDKSVISAIYLDILSSRNLVPVVLLFSNMPLPYWKMRGPWQRYYRSCVRLDWCCVELQWDYFGDAISSFLAYLGVSQKTGFKFVPKNNPIVQCDSTPTQSHT